MAGRFRAIAWGSFGVSVALCVASAVFLIRAHDVPTLPNEFGPKGFGIVFAISLGGVGAVVASRRPSNPIGWIFCGLGLLSSVMAFSGEYARWALLAEDGRPPAGTYAAWVLEWLWIPLVAALAMVAALFPDGRFLSPASRRVSLVSASLVVVPTVLAALVPELSVYRGYPNPVGVGGAWMFDLSEASVVLLLPVMFGGTASAFLRFRRARGEERQQLKWLVLSITVVAVAITLYGVLVTAFAGGVQSERFEWTEYVMIVGFVAVPVSIAFGVLKYRLYDIDVVINRAVVYGGLALFITVVYVAIVVGVGAAIGSRSNAFLSAVAAAVVALAFQPLRRRAQHLANRLVYGKRATPYEVLSELSTRFAGTYSLEDALPRLATVTAAAVGARRGRVWLRHDGELRMAASWPPGDRRASVGLVADQLPSLGEGEAAFPVRHQGELLGAISVTMPTNETLTPAQSQLVADVAGQAGLMLRNVALVQDLRESRQRLVAAQDHERRRIERDLHDGAQQQLVALSVKLRLAEQLAEADPDRARGMLAEVRQEAGEALENLRDLARGIYPPLLADEGLRVALESHARKIAVATNVESDGIGRYPREVESAVYFCVLEALQNVSKYARANRVVVRLAERNGDLSFVVEDDGVGFDPASARGSGLTNMRDRLEAIGGTLDVGSRPGAGTTVTGRVPVRHEEASA
jgi:signal transduction histidine kinase